jgi:hypothetical protein
MQQQMHCRLTHPTALLRQAGPEDLPQPSHTHCSRSPTQAPQSRVPQQPHIPDITHAHCRRTCAAFLLRHARSAYLPWPSHTHRSRSPTENPEERPHIPDITHAHCCRTCTAALLRHAGPERCAWPPWPLVDVGLGLPRGLLTLKPPRLKRSIQQRARKHLQITAPHMRVAAKRNSRCRADWPTARCGEAHQLHGRWCEQQLLEAGDTLQLPLCNMRNVSALPLQQWGDHRNEAGTWPKVTHTALPHSPFALGCLA